MARRTVQAIQDVGAVSTNARGPDPGPLSRMAPPVVGAFMPQPGGGYSPVRSIAHTDGRVEVFPVALAAGTSGMMGSMMSMSDWQAEQIGMWEAFDSNADGKREMRKALRWWRDDPIVFRCLRVLAQLCNSELKWDCDDDDTREFFEMWAEVALPMSFRQNFFLEYFRSGMVPVFKNLIEYQPRDYKDDKVPATQNGMVVARADASPREAQTALVLAECRQVYAKYKQAVALCDKAEERAAAGLCPPEHVQAYRRNVAAKQYEWLQKTIPGHYTILNPLLVQLDGPKEFEWLRMPYINIDQQTRTTILYPQPEQMEVINSLPREIVFQVRQGAQKVWLSPNVCTVVMGDKQPYERYPTPICSHAFRFLEIKSRLMGMDTATIDGVKNRILLVKVGDKDFPAMDPVQIQAVSKIFNTPARNMVLFWNHAIELEWVEPNLESLKATEKYAYWDDQIRTAFGISKVLTGSSETQGVIGNSVYNFKGVNAEVDQGQGSFLEWLTNEVRMVKAALKMAKRVTPKFDSLNMQDEVKFMAMVMQMVMNGLLDPETALETLHFNFPQVSQRMAKAKLLRAKGLFVPTPSANNLGPDGQLKPQGGGKLAGGKQGKPGGKGGAKTGGKPAGSPSAKNNSNRTGVSTPHKAKARFALANGTPVFVIDCDTLDPEQLQQVAAHFELAENSVLTRADYEKNFGSISFEPLYKELSPVETAKALADARRLDAKVQYATKEMIQTYRAGEGAAVKPPKRGPLPIDAQTKIVDTVNASVLKAWAEEHLGRSLPASFETNLRQVVSELKPMADMVEELGVGLDAYAWAVTAHRCSKSMAAPNVPDNNGPPTPKTGGPAQVQKEGVSQVPKNNEGDTSRV